MNIDELLERLRNKDHPYARGEAIVVLREQQEEIERLRKEIERLRTSQVRITRFVAEAMNIYPVRTEDGKPFDPFTDAKFIEELIERLEGDSSGPYYDALTSFALRREAAQALREQLAEIEELKVAYETK